MTQTEKLEEIIRYAIKKGYTNSQYEEFGEDWIKDSGYTEDGRLEHLIFSHSFLQAFFGETTIRIGNKEYLDTDDLYEMSWKYCAQRLVMVPEKLRIDFLYSFKEGK